MTETPCPCGGGSYASCCRPRHRGDAPAETAEALMRSRYSAFSLGLGEYITVTGPPSADLLTTPAPAEETLGNQTWLHLRIVDTEKGGPEDNEGFVEFVATFKEGGKLCQLHERSRFERQAGRWRYLSGELAPIKILRKPGRNAPCWCGSGRKLKSCHKD